MRQLEIEADLNSATDLFSGVSVSSKYYQGILSKSADRIIEDNKEKPIEEVKPKTRVEFEAYAKRLSAMIVANSVRTMLFSILIKY